MRKFGPAHRFLDGNRSVGETRNAFFELLRGSFIQPGMGCDEGFLIDCEYDAEHGADGHRLRLEFP